MGVRVTICKFDSREGGWIELTAVRTPAGYFLDETTPKASDVPEDFRQAIKDWLETT